MKIVAFYEMAPDGMAKVMANFPAHRAPFVTSGAVAKWRLVEWNAAFL